MTDIPETARQRYQRTLREFRKIVDQWNFLGEPSCGLVYDAVWVIREDHMRSIRALKAPADSAIDCGGE